MTPRTAFIQKPYFLMNRLNGVTVQRDSALGAVKQVQLFCFFSTQKKAGALRFLSMCACLFLLEFSGVVEVLFLWFAPCEETLVFFGQVS